MKRTISLFLVFILMLTMSIATFAETDGILIDELDSFLKTNKLMYDNYNMSVLETDTGYEFAGLSTKTQDLFVIVTYERSIKGIADSNRYIDSLIYRFDIGSSAVEMLKSFTVESFRRNVVNYKKLNLQQAYLVSNLLNYSKIMAFLNNKTNADDYFGMEQLFQSWYEEVSFNGWLYSISLDDAEKYVEITCHHDANNS